MIEAGIAIPAGGAGVEGLGGLLVILVALLLFALAWIWKGSIGWLMHKIASAIDVGIPKPWGGHFHPLGGAADDIRKWSDDVYGALTQAAVKTEGAAVWLFNQAHQQIVWLGAQLEGLADDVYHGIDDVVTREIPQAISISLWPVRHALKGIEGKAHWLEHYAKTELAKFAHGIDRLEKAALHALPHAITATKTQVGVTAKQLRRLARRTSALEKATAGLGAVALVGAALNRLGLRWLRCPALGRIGRKIGCGGFSWLEAFFAEAFEAMLVLDLCRFALAAQALARVLVPQLGGLLLVADAVCLGGGATLPSAADTPPTSTKITLPSAV